MFECVTFTRLVLYHAYPHAELYLHNTGLLQKVPECSGAIAQRRHLFRRIPVMRSLGDLAISLFVDTTVVHDQDQARENANDNKSQLEGMAKQITRRVLRSIEI